MDVPRRQKGRPRKEKDRIEPWQFGRAAMVMCAYDEARERGDKHSIAVVEAVEWVRLHDPEMPVSQTEVKRILAKWRPRGSRTILRFEPKVLTEDDIKKRRWVREQLLALQGNKDLKLEAPPNADLEPNGATFTIRFAERPNYPRHNRKNP